MPCHQFIYKSNHLHKKKHENVYVIHIDEVVLNVESCLIANDVHDNWLWHRRLGHASMKTLSKLVKMI